MLGLRFEKYLPPKDDRTPFEKLLPIFLEILTHTSGDVEEALNAPIPANSLDALRRRTRASQGRCQGFNCHAALENRSNDFSRYKSSAEKATKVATACDVFVSLLIL